MASLTGQAGPDVVLHCGAQLHGKFMLSIVGVADGGVADGNVLDTAKTQTRINAALHMCSGALHVRTVA